MKLSLVSLLSLACAATASYENGGTMEHLMSLKMASRERAHAKGWFDKDRYPLLSRRKCWRGKAGEYSCNNVDLLSFISHQGLGSETREGNDVWGWVSKWGREFGIVGQTDGVAFVEILPLTGSLRYVGRLATQTEPSVWRDIKVIGDHAYIGSEAPGHGLQIFDLNKLLKFSLKPIIFSPEKDLTAWYQGFGSSHNIVAHEETNTIYAVGTQRNLTCAGGLWIVDVSDPANPTSPGCVNEDGYVHDAQCVIYQGPDKKYTGHEICFNYNEDTLTIADVTDKKNPIQISSTPYVGAAYTHQGWLVDEKQEYLLLDDELDEMDGTGQAANGHTTTYIFDIKNLAAPKHTGTYQSPVRSIDHNQYVVDGLTYQSNYGSGLRIVDVSSVAKDPTGAGFEEVGFFDVHPEDDEVGGEVEFVGSWSVYPYFPSGYILLNSIERGIYSLKYTGRGAKH
ncbi:hypothetical protein BJX65DRAFT_69813 [Aspergillus insuetus]